MYLDPQGGMSRGLLCRLTTAGEILNSCVMSTHKHVFILLSLLLIDKLVLCTISHELFTANIILQSSPVPFITISSYHSDTNNMN